MMASLMKHPVQQFLPWYYKSITPSKFGKLSSGHRTGKGQFSFQVQRVQTTAQVHSSHMPAK